MFSLKSPTANAFKEQTKQEEKNLKTVYRIEAIPSDTQMRTTLDPFAPSPLRALFAKLFNKLSEAGVIKESEYWKSQVIVSIDGVEHFSSTKARCDHCTTRTHRNGETSYHHACLAAVLVHPDQEEVFTLDFEPILNCEVDHFNVCSLSPFSRSSRPRSSAGLLRIPPTWEPYRPPFFQRNKR